MLISQGTYSWVKMKDNEILLDLQADQLDYDQILDIVYWAKSVDIDIEYNGSNTEVWRQHGIRSGKRFTRWKIENENDRMMFTLKYAEYVITD